jgi:menaquinone-dependent protoporphyrinogen oxidase
MHDAPSGATKPRWSVACQQRPLDNWAAQQDIPPTPQVQKLLSRIGARGRITFGGRLSRDARGFPDSAMAKIRAGDWRRD